MAKKYRSRLARKEKQRMLRQSVLLFGLTGILVTAGLIWGIPAIVRMAGFMGELNASNLPIENNDTLAPLPPQLVIPYEATPSASIDIQGYTEAQAQVTLYNNDTNISETLADDTGAFIFEDIRLDADANQFTVAAKDQAGNTSELSRVSNVVFDNQAPTVEINEPSDGSEFFGTQEQTIEIKGSLDETAQVFVNDQLSFPDTENNFSQRYRLQPGENTITVRAIDSAGNEGSAEIKVNFSE